VGLAHGGANEAVLNMLNSIGDADNIGKYIQRVKDRTTTGVVRFATGSKLRSAAKIVQRTCHEVLEDDLKDDKLFKLALKLEKIALEDEYFIKRKLYPNVDFYSGIVYKALGIPTGMFTALFALARTVGWIAQWNEMIEDPQQKIGRPRQLFEGPTERAFVPLNTRK
jgi:citrate synthase